MQEVIKVKRLTKSYGKLLAVEDVSFSVGKGKKRSLENPFNPKEKRVNHFADLSLYG